MKQFNYTLSNATREKTTGKVTTVKLQLRLIVNGDFSVRRFITVPLESKPKKSKEFINWEDLTQETLVNWAKTSLGTEKLSEFEAELFQRHEALIEDVESTEFIEELPDK